MDIFDQLKAARAGKPRDVFDELQAEQAAASPTTQPAVAPSETPTAIPTPPPTPTAPIAQQPSLAAPPQIPPIAPLAPLAVAEPEPGTPDIFDDIQAEIERQGLTYSISPEGGADLARRYRGPVVSPEAELRNLPQRNLEAVGRGIRRGVGDVIVGAGETAASNLTGLGGMGVAGTEAMGKAALRVPVVGIAKGIRASGVQGLVEPARLEALANQPLIKGREWVKGIEDRTQQLTYAPRTETGQIVTEAVSRIGEPVFRAPGDVAEWAARQVGAEGAAPTIGALAEGVAPIAAFGVAKGVVTIPKAMKAYREYKASRAGVPPEQAMARIIEAERQARSGATTPETAPVEPAAEFLPSAAAPTIEMPPPERPLAVPGELKPPPEAPPVEPVPAAPAAPTAPTEPRARGQRWVGRKEEIVREPERFQFKGDVNEAGMGREMQEAAVYNPLLDQGLTLWRDPADGQIRVINGFNRLGKAWDSGYTGPLEGDVIDLPDAASARWFGAVENITQGRGTALDAAKLFRESGLGREELESNLYGQGVSLSGANARAGLGIAALDDALYRKVVIGELSEKQGAIIGRELPDHAKQRALVADLEEALSDSEVLALIHQQQVTWTAPTEQGGLGFPEPAQKSLSVPKAKVSSWIDEALKREKRVFAGGAKAQAVELLQQEGNVLKPEANIQRALGATQLREVFLRERKYASPVNELLNDAARRIARGEEPDVVRPQTYEAILRELRRAEGINPEAAARVGGAGPSEAPPEQAGLFGKPGERGSLGRMFRWKSAETWRNTPEEIAEDFLRSRYPRELADVTFSFASPEWMEARTGRSNLAGYTDKREIVIRPFEYGTKKIRARFKGLEGSESPGKIIFNSPEEFYVFTGAHEIWHQRLPRQSMPADAVELFANRQALRTLEDFRASPRDKQKIWDANAHRWIRSERGSVGKPKPKVEPWVEDVEEGPPRRWTDRFVEFYRQQEQKEAENRSRGIRPEDPFVGRWPRQRGSLGEMFSGDPLVKMGEELEQVPRGKRQAWLDKVAVTASRARDRLEESAALLHSQAAGTWKRYSERPPVTDYDRALGGFHLDESMSRLRQVRFAEEMHRAVPDATRQEAMTNWAMTGADPAKIADHAQQLRTQAGKLREIAEGKATLQDTLDWYASRERLGFETPRGKLARTMELRRLGRQMDRLAEGYDRALTVSPQEQRVAGLARDYFDAQLQRAIDAGWMKDGAENYVNRIWRHPGNRATGIAGDVGRLGTQPGFLKPRVFDEMVEGELAGMEPRTKHLGELTAVYDRSFNRAANARAFVNQLLGSVEADGKPTVAFSRATARVVGEEGEKPKPHVLVREARTPEELAKYQPVSHPAFRGWTFAGKDTEGKPVMYQGDALVHPDAWRKLRAVMETSKFATRPVVRGLLRANAELKGTTLSFSGFHQTQEGLHAIGHLVDPVGLVKKLKPFEDLVTDAAVQRGIRAGLETGTGDAIEVFSEGVNQPGLTRFIPKIGPALQHYQNFLFHDYIPRLKMSMYLDALERNTKRFGSKLTAEQIESLTADQANAAFGEQNYQKLARHPTTQAILRLTVFAPDFLEARGRFAGQALRPYGAEQRWALGRLAFAQYVSARIINALANDGDAKWDLKDAFTYVIGGRSYTLRSVPGDVLHLISDPRAFGSHRISSIGRPVYEMALGQNIFHEPVGIKEVLKNVGKNVVPMPFQAWSQGHDRPLYESAISAMGVTTRPYRTTATLKAREAFFNRAGNLTPEERERAGEHAKWLRRVQEGRGTMADVEAAAERGEIAPTAPGRIGRRSQQSELEGYVKTLSLTEALEIWDRSTGAEREALRPIIERKVAWLPRDWPQAQLPGLYKEAARRGFQPPAP